MTDGLSTWLLAATALLGVLGLIGVLARLARASGFAPAARAGRLGLVEQLPLDPRRRLVIARCDGREVLLLLGGPQDRSLGWLPPRDGAA